MSDSNNNALLLDMEVSNQDREDMDISMEEFPDEEDLAVLGDQDEITLQAIAAD